MAQLLFMLLSVDSCLLSIARRASHMGLAHL
jgi:hypothetical protein